MKLALQILISVVALVLIGLGVVNGTYVGEPPINLLPEIDKTEVRLEVANTEEARRKGLQGRESLPAGQGMLFVYPDTAIQCMWNRGIKFPLRVIFTNNISQLSDSEVMAANQTTPVCSKVPVRFVIEINP